MLRLRIDRPRRATDRVQDDAPEPLRIMLVAVHGYECDAAKVGRAVSPRAQQRGLPTSRRRRDDGHPLGHGAIQRLEKVIPVQQAPGDRNVSRDRLLRVQPVLLCRPAGHALPTVQYFDPGYVVERPLEVRRNDRPLGVINGTRAIITAIDRDHGDPVLEPAEAEPRIVRLPRSFWGAKGEAAAGPRLPPDHPQGAGRHRPVGRASPCQATTASTWRPPPWP